MTGVVFLLTIRLTLQACYVSNFHKDMTSTLSGLLGVLTSLQVLNFSVKQIPSFQQKITTPLVLTSSYHTHNKSSHRPPN